MPLRLESSSMKETQSVSKIGFHIVIYYNDAVYLAKNRVFCHLQIVFYREFLYFKALVTLHIACILFDIDLVLCRLVRIEASSCFLNPQETHFDRAYIHGAEGCLLLCLKPYLYLRKGWMDKMMWPLYKTHFSCFKFWTSRKMVSMVWPLSLHWKLHMDWKIPITCSRPCSHMM